MTMKNLHPRLYAFPIIFCIVMFLFCSGNFWLLSSIEKGIHAEALANIKAETDLVSRIIRPMLEAGEFDSAKKFCNSFNSDTLRLTLISHDGFVEADSGKFVREPDNHLNREEVRDALVGLSKITTRQSETTGLWMTYYAVALPLDSTMFILRTAVGADQTTRLLLQARSIYWSAVIFSVFIAVLIAWNVHRRIHRPLTELQKSMDCISRGNLDVPIVVPSKGVVRPIALLAQKMTAQLCGQIMELRRLENLRREFLANVSHELKTPMTSILVAVETLRDTENLSAEMHERLLEMIYSQTVRLSNLVRDILTLSSLEEGREGQQSHFLPVRLSEVVDGVVSEMSNAAEQKGCTIHANKNEEDLRTLGDAQLLIQALGNIVANALKYSGSPTMEIELRKTGSFAEIACIDHGCGIPQEHWERIFERFYRVNRERSRKLGGTGLGLAIVKHIAMLHKGTVAIMETPGGGSTFLLRLPLC